MPDSSTPPTETTLARATVVRAPQTHKLSKPEVCVALTTSTGDTGQQVKSYLAIRNVRGNVPAAATPNVRNDIAGGHDHRLVAHDVRAT